VAFLSVNMDVPRFLQIFLDKLFEHMLIIDTLI
jgi:hypothetical protein